MGLLSRISTKAPGKEDKETIKLKSAKLNTELCELQNVLFAENKHKVLVILQGMDASGKDGAVKNVFNGVNPLGIRVKSFKSPTELEKSYNFLWRVASEVPPKGMIHVFNRSHYEDILYPAVHKLFPKEILNRRMEQINSFEQLLSDDGTVLFKFYLHISKKEQRERLMKRITMPEKNWKYHPSDLKEARFWNDYMDVYETIFKKCGKDNPWKIIPASQNWYRDYVILEHVVETLRKLKMKYPKAKS